MYEISDSLWIENKGVAKKTTYFTWCNVFQI